MFGGSVSFLESQFQQRLVQVCLFAAILFWILGSYNLIDQVQKLLSKVGLRFGKDSTRVVHALIFAVLLYLLTRFIMDPVVRRLSNGSVVEGQANQIGASYTCPVNGSQFNGSDAYDNCTELCSQPCVSNIDSIAAAAEAAVAAAAGEADASYTCPVNGYQFNGSDAYDKCNEMCSQPCVSDSAPAVPVVPAQTQEPPNIYDFARMFSNNPQCSDLLSDIIPADPDSIRDVMNECQKRVN